MLLSVFIYLSVVLKLKMVTQQKQKSLNELNRAGKLCSSILFVFLLLASVAAAYADEQQASQDVTSSGGSGAGAKVIFSDTFNEAARLGTNGADNWNFLADITNKLSITNINGNGIYKYDVAGGTVSKRPWIVSKFTELPADFKVSLSKRVQSRDWQSYGVGSLRVSSELTNSAYNYYKNAIVFGHVGHLQILHAIININGVNIYENSGLPITQGEWDGSDGIMHKYSIEKIGNTVNFYKDDVKVDSFTDVRIGAVKWDIISNDEMYNSITLFDDFIVEDLTPPSDGTAPIVTNGDFESGITGWIATKVNSWGQYPLILVRQDTAGNSFLAMDVPLGAAAKVEQQITLPQTSDQLVLNFDFWGDDNAVAFTVYAGGKLLRSLTPPQITHGAKITTKSYDLSEFAGKTITLRFDATSSGGSGTIANVDNVRIFTVSGKDSSGKTISNGEFDAGVSYWRFVKVKESGNYPQIDIGHDATRMKDSNYLIIDTPSGSEAYVEQNIDIPQTDKILLLNFEVWGWRDTPTLIITLGGQLIGTIYPSPLDRGGEIETKSYDVSKFSGQTVKLRFDATASGTNGAYAVIDNVDITTQPLAPPPADGGNKVVFKTDTLINEPRFTLTQTGDRSFTAAFDDCASCPGCFSQVMVSSQAEPYTRIADANGGCSVSTAFTLPADVHEFWAGRDEDYSLNNAINNWNNRPPTGNAVLHVAEDVAPPAPTEITFDWILGELNKGGADVNVVKTADYGTTGLNFQPMTVEQFKQEQYYSVPGMGDPTYELLNPVVVSVPDSDDPENTRLLLYAGNNMNEPMEITKLRKVAVAVSAPPGYIPFSVDGKLGVQLLPEDLLSCVSRVLTEPVRDLFKNPMQEGSKMLAEKAIGDVVEDAIPLAKKAEIIVTLLETGFKVNKIFECTDNGLEVDLGKTSGQLDGAGRFETWIPVGWEFTVEAKAYGIDSTMLLSGIWTGTIAEDTAEIVIALTSEDTDNKLVPPVLNEPIGGSPQTGTGGGSGGSSSPASSGGGSGSSDSSSGSSGGSSGGGGGGGSLFPGVGKTTTYISDKVAPSQPLVFTTSKDSSPVTNFEMSVKYEAANPKVSITELKEPSVTYKNAKTTYKYVLNDNVNAIKLDFKVPKSWLTENKVDKTAVKLVRYHDSWSNLQVQITGEDSEFVYYTATTPGLSVFAIVVEEQPVVEQKAVVVKKELSIAAVLTEISDKLNVGKSIAVFFVLVAVPVLSVIAAVKLYERRRRIRHGA
jgi:PGF-pre-PGF domain-containing protein